MMNRKTYQKGLMEIYREIETKYGLKHNPSILRHIVCSLLKDRNYLGFDPKLHSALEDKVWIEVIDIADAPLGEF